MASNVKKSGISFPVTKVQFPLLQFSKKKCHNVHPSVWNIFCRNVFFLHMDPERVGEKQFFYQCPFSFAWLVDQYFVSERTFQFRFHS